MSNPSETGKSWFWNKYDLSVPSALYCYCVSKKDDPLYYINLVVTYYIKWVTTSWTYSITVLTIILVHFRYLSLLKNLRNEQKSNSCLLNIGVQ